MKYLAYALFVLQGELKKSIDATLRTYCLSETGMISAIMGEQDQSRTHSGSIWPARSELVNDRRVLRLKINTSVQREHVS